MSGVDEFSEAMKSAAKWHKRTPVEQAEMDRAAAGAFPGGPSLKAGDWVLHPKSGRAQVRKIESSTVYLVFEDDRKMELSEDETDFAPHSIEKGDRRVFSMSPKVPR